MTTLFHLPLDVTSRFVRLALAEYGVETHQEIEKVWDRRKAFLALNPAATVPVVKTDEELILVGANPIVGFFSEAREDCGAPLMPTDAPARAEVRRLIDWALILLEGDVTSTLVHEKAMKRQIPSKLGGGPPDTGAMRVCRDNLQWHLDYTDHLIATRDWLAGERITLADLAFGAAYCTLDYLGEIKWANHEVTKAWYARLKSRPSFDPLLAERVSGVVPPNHYADPDF